MKLKLLQQQFQSTIFKSDTMILSEMTPHRMTIYQNSYYERIISALKQDFPVLCNELGESAFSGLARDYIQSHPSTHYNLRIIGQYLSEFILSKDPDFAYYADLARLEWLVCCDDWGAVESFESRYDVMKHLHEYYGTRDAR